MTIRPARSSDVSQLLRLMQELAVFEGYRDRFAVTEADLLQRGFSADREPQFHAFVAAGDDDTLVGYALTYLIPFTFDLRPTLVLKEFFVDADHRSEGLGHSLYSAVIDHGRRAGARLLRWQVLPENQRAIQFYRSFGAKLDADWENWVLELQVLEL